MGGTVATWLVNDADTWMPGSVANAQVVGGRAEIAPVAASSIPLNPANSGLTPEEQTNIRVYDGASRGVVNILTRTVSYDRFFMLPSPGEGAGSGSVLDKKGHILTNFHVVEGANKISVTLPGGKQAYEGELIGSDPENDIAVLKIDAPSEELFPVPVGTSDSLKVGQRVYTLGNPFGLEGTLTTGIISNLNRTLPSRTGREMKSIIQTDAAMNPGNSGGPLLDTSGRMIGMSVAIATKTGQSAGLGFAIPVNRIRQSVTQLIEHGKVIRADIGIVAVAETPEGLQIVQTNRGGPAERAGLRGWKRVQREVTRGPLVYTIERNDPSAADVIVAVNGQSVEKASAFVEKIEEHRPGDQVVLTVIREGKQIQVPVTLGAT
ncbi:MAG: trypsin-like peptidase domain-containing protein [Planctomycetes bacterium]|nr:trypsin-like peptidase domain-containing protein [Planctomycetota bacterium]